MPSLAETQIPFLRRDIKHGLVPKKQPSESDQAYYSRLALLYNLSKQQVADEIID